jgi:hypothetical protein
MSNDQLFIFLNRVAHGSIYPFPLLSRNKRTSGARYSGVVAGTDLTFLKMNEDPKSINFKVLILTPSKSTKMLSGLMSA